MELDREEQVLGQQLSRKLRLCAGQYGMDESIGNYIFDYMHILMAAVAVIKDAELPEKSDISASCE